MQNDRYQLIANKFICGEYTSIKTDDKKSYRRIINRCMSQGWWFASWQQEGQFHVAFSHSIDLKKLQAKLPAIKFELD